MYITIFHYDAVSEFKKYIMGPIPTRMHSSRMHTISSSGRILGGVYSGGCLLWGVGVCSGGVCLGGVCSGGCLLWGMSALGGCLLLGGVYSMGCLLWGVSALGVCSQGVSAEGGSMLRGHGVWYPTMH